MSFSVMAGFGLGFLLVQGLYAISLLMSFSVMAGFGLGFLLAGSFRVSLIVSIIQLSTNFKKAQVQSPCSSFFSEMGSLRLVLVSFSSFARKTSSITVNKVLRSAQGRAIITKSSTNISAFACIFARHERFGSQGTCSCTGPPCFTWTSFALLSNLWNGCSFDTDSILAFVMSAIVSGRQSGNATRRCLPGMSGKIEASFGISSMREFTL